MNLEAGKPFDLAADNAPIPGCTVSNRLTGEDVPHISVFSLGAHTDISPEMHPERKLVLVLSGAVTATIDTGAVHANAGELLAVPAEAAFGVAADVDSTYLDLALRKDDTMNEQVKSGQAFKLADLVPYRDGQIVNMDVAHGAGGKFAVMAFDQGTGLDEHAAPGDALVFALEGEGIVGYEGKEYRLQAGENFKFDKGGKHYVKAPDGRFKMALLLVKE